MKNRNDKIRLITFGGILTALVILLQYFSNYIYFGPFSITLALIPILIGAILFGPFMGAWLGFVFGLVVLLSGQAAPFMLISAFAGRENVLRAYEEAVRERYRFFSFGDAMLIL